MHAAELSQAEQRVLGCLIEKRFTTPDQYPLSLNALRSACNQSTNRDPVLGLDEETVNAAAQRLSRYGLARLASGHSSRATKYRHLAEEGLGVDQPQLGLLCVLLLRGPQTPGELKGRTERMVAFNGLGAVEATLAALTERGYVERMARRPGQKEDRWRHRLGGGGDADASAGSVGDATARAGATPEAGGPPSAPPAAPDPGSGPPATTGTTRIEDLAARVERLEAEVAELRAQAGSASPTR